MKIPPFELEEMLVKWENVVEYNLSGSTVNPFSLNDLAALGLELDQFENMPITYVAGYGSDPLRSAIAELYPGATADNIETTNSTSLANFLVSLALIEDGDEVLIQMPNYLQMHGVFKSHGAVIRTFDLNPDNNWEPDWDTFENNISARTKFIYVSNPNNPTGSVLSENAIKRLVDAAEKYDSYILADEIFQGSELGNELTQSLWNFSNRVIITNGLSKSYSLPGARIGWITAPEEVIKTCWSQYPSIALSTSFLSDRVARIVLQKENRNHVFERTRNRIRQNAVTFRQWVDNFSEQVSCIETKAGGFAFLKYELDLSSVTLALSLKDNQNILVSAGAHFGMEGYLRINLGMENSDFEIALSRIKDEINKLIENKPMAALEM